MQSNIVSDSHGRSSGRVPRRPLASAALSVLLLAAAWPSPAASVTSGRTVAMLVNDDDGPRVEVEREGGTLAYDPGTGFLACDIVRLKPSPQTTSTLPVTILTMRHESVTLTPRGWSAECGAHSVDANVLAKARNAFTAVELKQSVGATSRAIECPHNDGDVPALDIPILPDRVHTMLVARDGPFFINWTRDFAPFGLEITTADTGRQAFARSAIPGNGLSVDHLGLARGVYRLKLTDRCGRAVLDDHLEIVDVAQRPAMPSELAAMDEPQRTLFYADYLASADEGRWSLEAMQLVAALRPRTPAAAAWLEGWGR
jgi:hypothetical protein